MQRDEETKCVFFILGYIYLIENSKEQTCPFQGLTLRLFSGFLFFQSLRICALYFHMSLRQEASRLSRFSKLNSRCSKAILLIFCTATLAANLLTSLSDTASSWLFVF